MAEETQELCERAQKYEAQVIEARADKLAVARAPLLELMERLQDLAVGIRAHLPTLHLARSAMDLLPPAPTNVGSPRHSPVGAGGSSPSRTRPHESSEARVDILDPSRYFGMFSAAKAVGRKVGDRALAIVEFSLELIENVGRAAGLIPLVLLEDGATPEDVIPDRPSPWVAVLETLRDGLGRTRREVGRLPCFAGILRPPRLTTGYWKFRGLGAPMRMMCAYSGVDWEDMQYEVEKTASCAWMSTQWEQFDRPDLTDTNALTQLPYVVNHTTGEVVTQSAAVSMYLGRVLGLMGPTKLTRMADEQVLFYVHSVWLEVRDLVYPGRRSCSEEEFRTSLEPHFRATLPAHYEKLETWLRMRGTGFFAGWNPCVSDFHVWELLDQHELLARACDFPSPVADYEILQAFHMYFRFMPRLQSYFESKDAKLPVNNKMAFFK